MSLFDFVVNNAADIEKLYTNEDGNIEIDVDEFDFSHDDVELEVDSSEGATRIVFSVQVGQIKLATSINIDNIKDAGKHIKDIKDIDTRRLVIETIEDEYRTEAEAERDKAQEAVDEAKVQLDQTQEDFDSVVDTLTDLKSNWNIP